MFTDHSGDGRVRVRAALAAILGTTTLIAWSPVTLAAAPADEAEEEEAVELEEVQVTGSRIVRRDTQSNSPLVTVDRAKLEESTYVSIEQALNELPQFMAGGAGMGAGAVTGMTDQGTLNGGAGSGTMFDNTRLPETGGRVGTFTPGSAVINLRGLGSNRSLTLIDGRRGQPTNASLSLDLNTIPSAAIGNIEVITGGASAVYGADALAGVTNIKLRENFEGLEVRIRGGLNEAGGDGKEYQASTLMGMSIAGKGNAMVGLEFSKREVAYWRNRSFFREAMESQYSSIGSYSFSFWPGYDSSTGTVANSGCVGAGVSQTCVTNSTGIAAGGGSNSGTVWTGNRPSQTAVNTVFGDRTCGTSIACVANTGPGGGFLFNADGTLFVRNSSLVAGGVTTNYGPQSYTGPLGNSADNPTKVSCSFTENSINATAQFSDRQCAPSLNRVDWGRWLTSPREAFNLFGSAKYAINDNVEAFSMLSFASSEVRTRREPAPATGTFTAAIPYHSDPNARYLPSIAQQATAAVAVGDTLPEYRVGGTRGTNCGPVGGCTMAQAFPVTPELATLLNSRPTVNYGTTGLNATNPWRGLSACEIRSIDANTGLPGHTAQVPASGSTPAHTVQYDPNTGETYKICGPNSSWRLAQFMNFLPSRGTVNIQRTFQLTAGLRGDLGLGDWTWEAYTSQGDARTNTEYVGLMSTVNYRKIVQAPNYGRGFREENTNAAKLMTCTSGLSPFMDYTQVSADCIAAVSSNQVDRNIMLQRVYEANFQGGIAELPAGQIRAAVGAGYRWNSYTFTADSLRERDYVNDTSAGQFGIGSVDADVDVKEAYGELLIPLLRDMPFARNLELELGSRVSKYSTGQDVPTFKALLSWEPISYVRARGGYNRAERAPNIAELYTAPSTNTAGGPFDPCRTDSTTISYSNNPTLNANYLQVRALCSAQIDLWGGNGGSEFQANPTSFTLGGGVATVVGDENLKSEKGQTWTLGVVLTSPFTHPLASRLTGTFDWYEVRIDRPIEVRTSTSIAAACFNQNGENPTYSLDDAGGYCRMLERDPTTGALARVVTPYANSGKLVVRGMDFSVNWSATLVDLGMGDLPGSLSVNSSANVLFDQIQPLTAGGVSRDYVGLTGASKLRTNTSVNYSWGNGSRVGLTWQYRLGTHTPIAGTTDRDPDRAGYPSTNMFNATAGSRFGAVNASVSISNLLNTKPGPGAYFFEDATQGLGTFNPYGDTVGRRYSFNVSMDF